MKNLLYEEKTPEMSKACYFYFSPLLFISVLTISTKKYLDVLLFVVLSGTLVE